MIPVTLRYFSEGYMKTDLRNFAAVPRIGDHVVVDTWNLRRMVDTVIWDHDGYPTICLMKPHQTLKDSTQE